MAPSLMSEPRVVQWSPPSNLPVVAPHPTRKPSGLPSSPHPTFVPSIRRSSSSPNAASPASASPANTSGGHNSGSGIPTFRALRSLLPFGPSKQPAPPVSNTVANPPKSPFANFGSMRRSLTGERKSSFSTPRTKPDDSPVISIDASQNGTEPIVRHGETGESFRSFTVQRDTGNIILPQPSPEPLLSADLSTIIEADTSGISKHIPVLENSNDLDSKNPWFPPHHCGSTQHDTKLPQHPAPTNTRSGGNPSESQDDSLDLSTSELTGEVLDAMMVKDFATATDWLSGANGVVVDDVVDDSGDDGDVKEGLHIPEGNCSISFNLDAVDPDLEVLLSPNRMVRSGPTIITSLHSPSHSSDDVVDVGTIAARSRSTLQSPSPVPSNHDSSPSKSSTHPSPNRKPPPLLRSTPSRPPSAPPLPRLRVPKDIPGSLSTSPDHSVPDNTTRRRSSDSTRQHPPPSPLATNATSSGRYHAGGDHSGRKPPQSRLVTPTRHAPTQSSASSKRLPLHHLLAASPTRDKDPIPLSSRASPVESAASRRNLLGPRPSLDTDSRTDIADRDRTFLLRSRKRSMSVEEHRGSRGYISPHQTPSSVVRPSSSLSNAAPAADWLGPRTAKAFAAAGLLDFDKDIPSTMNGSTSRFGLPRNNSERDYRSQFSLSRMTPSEPGSISSWGRSGSISRTMTVSEAGGHLIESPTLSSTTPRTGFSSGSTAPTSVSAVSSVHQVQSTVQSMKEKHEVETEALLSALSDSQRLTKMLRDENGDLRERIHRLEEQLQDAHRQIQRFQSAPLPSLAHPMPRWAFDSRSRSGSTDGVQRHLQPRMQPLSNYSPARTPIADNSPIEHHPVSSSTPPLETANQNYRKRFSTTSSIFPVPPSNMTMLMHEDGVIGDNAGTYSSHSMSPSLPTTGLPKRSSNARHVQNRSMSSGESISPMTANFSMTEMTGSPGSLYLRPEHEVHLGDMASLDIGYHLEDARDEGG